MKKPWVLSYPFSAQRRLWSDWADGQADLRSEDSDRTGWMPRLIRVFAGRTLILLVLSCRGSLMLKSITSRTGGFPWRYSALPSYLIDSAQDEWHNPDGLINNNKYLDLPSSLWSLLPCSKEMGKNNERKERQDTRSVVSGKQGPWQLSFELRHDKTNKTSVRPAKTQISLGIRTVWSRVFAVRMKKPWVLSYPLSAQRRLWSDWVNAQSDLSLRWAHTHFVGFVMSSLICVCSDCTEIRKASGAISAIYFRF